MEETGIVQDMPVSNSDEVASSAQEMIDQAKKDFVKFKETNPNAQPNNVKIYIKFLNRLMKAANNINELSPADRETYYHIVYNSTVAMYDICRMLRKGNYHKEAAKYYAFIVLCCNTNIILTAPKYLSWRVKNYIELAGSYAD